MKHILNSKRFISIFIILSLMLSLTPFGVFASEGELKETDYPAAFARYRKGKKAWEENSMYPLSGVKKITDERTTIVNDGSAEYPAESYVALDDIDGGIVNIDYSFFIDREMDGASFRLLGKKDTIFGIVTQGSGLYLEQPNGKNEFLCSYKTSLTDVKIESYVRAELDFDKKIIRRVQINGVTYAKDMPFASEATVADGFDVRTTKEAVGYIELRGLFIDRGYFVHETFENSGDYIADDWQTVKGADRAVIYNTNNYYADRARLLMDTSSSDVVVRKAVEDASGKLTFEVNVLQEEKRDNIAINLLEGNDVLFSFTANGNSFCYSDENGQNVPFYNYIKNVWYNLEIHMDTEAGTFDLDINNRSVKKGLKFKKMGFAIDGIEIFAGQNEKTLKIDEVFLYRIRPYADDYPVLGEIPAKAEGAPLVGIQMCPMWIEGYHFGWDWIKQASNRRIPVTGFYDGLSSEQADWSIKYMLEHGVDYMSVCMFPNDADSNKSAPVDPLTDKDGRSTAQLSAILNSRYSDKIKYSIFLEANGITQGHSYYDDFFETVWPFYIEHYFKDPRYLKVDGRPVFGVYSSGNLFNVFNDGSGAESIRAGVERMRQMCIDAGVGNPYLVVNNGSYQVGLASSAGFDAVSSYGLGQDATFTYQKSYFKQIIEECKQAGVDFIPSPVPMRDDTAWRVDAGYWHTEEEFDAFLKWMKDDLLKGYTPSVKTPLCNMCTWDEFGEGHIIYPTEGLGFRYLDAIRSALTTGGEHTDDIPTQAQKERITHLYDEDKKIENVIYESTVDYRIFYEAREKDPAEKIPTDVKKGWYFANSAGGNNVTAVSQVSSIKSTQAGLEVYPSDRNPRISLAGLDNLDLYDTTYVKIRMKKNPSSGGGFVHWSTDVVPGMDDDKKIFFNQGVSDGSQFEEYYAPVSSSVNWTGKIDNLEIMLGDVSDFSQPFVIESIEILQDKDLTAADKIVVDGRIVSMTDAFAEKGSTVMVPLKETLYIAGASEIRHFVVDDTYTVKYNDKISHITLGSKTADVAGQAFSLPEAPYAKSEIISDTMYVPLTFAEAVLFDKEVSYDEKSRTLTVNSKEVEEVKVNKEIIHQIEFDEEAELNSAHGVSEVVIKDGKFTAMTANNDPNFSVILNKNAEDVKFVQIKINTSHAQNLKFYFITNKDTSWGEAKGSTSVTTTPGDNTIMFDTSMVSTWTDTITTFRIDPSTSSGHKFSLDSITFYGDDLKVSESAEEGVDMSPCLTVKDNCIEWNFTKNTAFDGWQFNKAFSDTTPVDGKISAGISGTSPIMMNYRDIGENADKFDKLVIKYANNSSSDKLKIYFITDKNASLNEMYSYTVDVEPMNQSVEEYVVNLKENANWNGKIKRIVIVPGTNIYGKVIFDNIALMFSEGGAD